MTKTKKRNLTLLALLMFVSAAVLLNWSYNQRWGKPNEEMVSTVDSGIEEAAARAQKMAASSSGYFSEARLTRQVSRDQALELLQTAASSESASQETIDSAMNAISAMATNSMKEAQIENLLIAKDFTDCVVYIGNEAVTVAVPAPSDGLTEEAVAQITDIILNETSYEASQISIIEVKA